MSLCIPKEENTGPGCFLFKFLIKWHIMRMVEAGGHLWRSSDPPPAQSRSSQRGLLRVASSQVLIISKDADPTTALHNLLQHLTALTVKKNIKNSLLFKGHVLYFNSWPLPRPFTGHH